MRCTPQACTCCKPVPPDVPHAVERKAGDIPAWSTPHPGWSALCALIGHFDGKRARCGP